VRSLVDLEIKARAVARAYHCSDKTVAFNRLARDIFELTGVAILPTLREDEDDGDERRRSRRDAMRGSAGADACAIGALGL
jgi:hypothetical protein